MWYSIIVIFLSRNGMKFQCIIYILWGEHTVNIYSDIILLASSPKIEVYDIMPCDVACNHSHISFYNLRNIKSRKIDNNKKKNVQV